MYDSINNHGKLLIETPISSMEQTSPYLFAELEKWPSKQEMARMLKRAGLNVTVGRFSIRIEDFERFKFQQYGGDLGEPEIEAEAATLDRMMYECGIVSEILSRASIRHCFEIYGPDREELIGYLHYDWPLEE